ncbi:MAG: hypothetical protein JNL80_17440 [Phycisphaerae bacterium]|nr:hypothetical protein [Phycisphaerae bacterium]
MLTANLILSIAVAGSSGLVTYVDANLSSGLNNGTSWTNAFRGELGLKSAIAAGAQVIWVADGTYYPGPAGSPSTTTFNIGPNVMIIGGFAGGEVDDLQANPAVNIATLSGDLPGGPAGQPELEAVVTLTNGNTSTLLIGLTIDVCLNGTPANALASPRRGVVVNGGSPHLERCTIRDGRAPKGAGVHIINGSQCTAYDCVFIDNIAQLAGGGVYSDATSDTHYTQCLFKNNGGGLGAGLYLGAYGNERAGGAFPSLWKCDFVNNGGVFGAASGGGIYCRNTIPELQDCRFVHCIVAGGGGAIFSQDSNVWMDRCSFIDCSAAGDGGGAIYANNTQPSNYQTTDISNCLFTGNHNSLFARNGAEIDARNCTFANGRAQPGQPLLFPTIVATGGMPSSILVSNSIIWGNVPFNGAPVGGNVLALGGSTVQLDRCDAEGWSGPLAGIVGTGNFSANPLFIDRDGADGLLGNEDDDLHLMVTSPCVDSGNANLVNDAYYYDLEHNDRFIDVPSAPNVGSGWLPYLDIGCYEFAPPPCLTDITGDGQTNASDLAILLGDWGTTELRSDFDGSGNVGAADLAILLGGFGPCE